LRLLAAQGPAPCAFKPYESGVGPASPNSDSRRLQAAGGGWQPLSTVTLHRFRAPLAPGIAAKLERRRPSWPQVLTGFRRLGEGPGVVEGAGGLLVPLDERHEVVDLVAALRLPTLVVARAGLGTLNHTALTLEALAQRRLEVAAVVLVASSPGGDPSVRHNRAALEARFPKLRVLGPVPHLVEARRRARAFERALLPLL
jgi:dethiobiotin synthetase